MSTFKTVLPKVWVIKQSDTEYEGINGLVTDTKQAICFPSLISAMWYYKDAYGDCEKAWNQFLYEEITSPHLGPEDYIK